MNANDIYYKVACTTTTTTPVRGSGLGLGARVHAERAAEDHSLDVREILMELGERRMVGGQEDMIVDVALDLAKRNS